MGRWRINSSFNDSYCFFGLRFTLGSNELLGCYSYNESSSALPLIGPDLVVWLWGGYSIDNATLNRFFSFHYVLPFIILGLAFVHLVFLHEHHSNNPLGVEAKVDYVYMYPYYIIKDVYGIVLFITFFAFFVFFAPNVLGHPDNYIPANPLVLQHI